MSEASPVSVVICTIGRPDLIGAAAGSVLANRYPNFELTVVDQSKDDSTRRALEAFAGDPRYHYLHLDRVGLSAAYNAGIAASRSDVLAFTDDDCVAPPNWVSAVVNALERHPDVELLYGQTLVAPALKNGPGEVPSMPIAAEEKIGEGHGFRIAGMGANFALRRRLIDRIGGFDEALGGGGPLKSSQDFDFQFRTYRAGAVCLLTPDVWVDHYGVRNSEQWPKTLEAYGVGDGAFYWKHVRCGDLLALRLFATRLARGFAREALNPIRRKPSNWPYYRSCLTGMWRSMKFRIDRDRRLYKPAGSG
jgi:glycosyltransferase involved in cell wall biosynthesis